jgi:hypothetical protein
MKDPKERADEMITIMQEAGLTPDDMLVVIRLVRRKLECKLNK